MTTIDVAPQVLDWAVSRGGTSPSVLRKKFPRLERWRRGEAHPTLAQLEQFAQTTNTPFGFLLLDQPPQETVPMVDFRTRSERSGRRSANLLDQVYLCEQRQAWFIEHAQRNGYEPLSFIGSMTPDVLPDEAAESIRRDLRMAPTFAATQKSQGEAVSAFAQLLEDAGVLVMISGIVGANTHRPLDAEEFSGFSLSDEYAPVIFINGVDSKRAQVFTLMHELAHLYLGDSALSYVEPGDLDDEGHEEWCNAVAARILIDAAVLRGRAPRIETFPAQLEDLSRYFKVSTLVILRRMLETQMLTRDQFFPAYREERERLRRLPRSDGSSGGSFYNTAPVRSSKRFTRAILRSTLEGETVYTEAFAMLGTHRSESIRNLAFATGAI